MCHLCGQLLYPCNLSFLFSVRSCSCLTHELDLSAVDECRVGKAELPNYLWDQGPVVEFLTYSNRISAQQSAETVDEFALRVRRLAPRCQFTDVEVEIRTQIVQTCVLEKVREKAFMEDLKLDDLLTYAMSVEATKLHMPAMSGSASTRAAGNALRLSSSQFQEMACVNCGKGGHITGGNSCPAKGKHCRSCGKSGHFAKRCQGKKAARKKLQHWRKGR